MKKFKLIVLGPDHARVAGWACFRDTVPFSKKHLAKEGGGLIFEVSVFLETTVPINYKNPMNIAKYLLAMPVAINSLNSIYICLCLMHYSLLFVFAHAQLSLVIIQ